MKDYSVFTVLAVTVLFAGCGGAQTGALPATPATATAKAQVGTQPSPSPAIVPPHLPNENAQLAPTSSLEIVPPYLPNARSQSAPVPAIVPPYPPIGETLRQVPCASRLATSDWSCIRR